MEGLQLANERADFEEPADSAQRLKKDTGNNEFKRNIRSVPGVCLSICRLEGSPQVNL